MHLLLISVWNNNTYNLPYFRMIFGQKLVSVALFGSTMHVWMGLSMILRNGLHVRYQFLFFRLLIVLTLRNVKEIGKFFYKIFLKNFNTI